jgi:hypothetical protein
MLARSALTVAAWDMEEEVESVTTKIEGEEVALFSC